MKLQINKDDISTLTGRFIVQLNANEPNPDFKKNAGFWIEKRISFIGRLYGVDGLPNIELKNKQELIILNGFYYTHGVYTVEEFIEYFNHYIKQSNKRFHRLLTAKELDWLNNEMKIRSL